MNTWKVILATMAIFATGVVTGGLLVEHANAARRPRPQRAANANRPAQPPPSPGGLRLALLRQMQAALNLTPEQNERIDTIIRQGQERTRKVMDPVRPQIQEELHKVMTAFRETLTPEQRARFEALLKQQRQNRRPPPPRNPAATNASPY